MPEATPKQEFARSLNGFRELLLSGTGGSGKSECGLILALDYIDDPEYNALILMRTITDLKKSDALQDRMKVWFQGTNAMWDADAKKWRFPSGATIEIGYLRNADDALNYKSSQYHFIFIDELSMIEEFAYTYLFFRLRKREGCTIPLRMRAATNPDGPHADWVQKRFVPQAYLDAESPEARFTPGLWAKQARDQKGRLIERNMLAFWAKDNPFLDWDEYDESLTNLDDVTYQQVALGMWGVRRGAIFRASWFQPIARDLVPWRHLRLCRSWDLAHTNADDARDRKTGTPDWTVGTLYGVDDRTEQRYVLDCVTIQGDPGQVYALVQATALRDGEMIPIVVEQEPAAGINVIWQLKKNLPRHVLHGYEPRGRKEERAQPVSLLASKGQVSVAIAAWNETWFERVAAFPHGKRDWVDSLSQAENWMSEGSKTPFGAHWSPEHHLLKTSEIVKFAGPESRGRDVWRGGVACFRPPSRWQIQRFVYVDEIGTRDGCALYTARPPEGEGYKYHKAVFVFRLVTLAQTLAPRDILSQLQRHEETFAGSLVGSWLPPEAKKLQEAYAVLHNSAPALWDADERFGIAPLKDGLRVDQKEPHPFVEGLMGRPLLYFVVDVDGKGRPKMDDSGMLALLQGLQQFALEEKGGLREAVEFPALLCLRAAASVYFGGSTTKTYEELVDDLMPEGLRARDGVPSNAHELEGFLLAKQVHRAGAERQMREQANDTSIFWGTERIVDY